MREYVETHRINSSSAARFSGRLGLFILAAMILLSGCSQSASNDLAAANMNKVKLDSELHTAQVSYGIPTPLLQPIEQQESALAAAVADGSDKTGQSAANGYVKLYQQVVSMEKLTPAQIQQKATLDLQAFTQALQKVQAQSFVEANTFQTHLQLAQQQLAAATTAKEYFAVDGYIVDQTNGVSQIIPIYQQMQKLSAMVTTQGQALGSTVQPLQCAIGDVDSFWVSDAQILSDVGLDPSSAVMVGTGGVYDFQSWPTEDLAAFRSGQDGSRLFRPRRTGAGTNGAAGGGIRGVASAGDDNRAEAIPGRCPDLSARRRHEYIVPAAGRTGCPESGRCQDAFRSHLGRRDDAEAASGLRLAAGEGESRA